MTVQSEQRIFADRSEVVLLTVKPNSRQSARRAAADRIHKETGALVLIVDEGDVAAIETLSPALMREHGWVRVEELDRVQHAPAPRSTGVAEPQPTGPSR